VLIQNLRTQGPFECFFLSTLSSRGYQTIGFNHRRILQGFESNFSACLMPSATLLSAGSCLTTAWDARSLQPRASRAFSTSLLVDLTSAPTEVGRPSMESLSLSSSNKRSAVFLPTPGTRVSNAAS